MHVARESSLRLLHVQGEEGLNGDSPPSLSYFLSVHVHFVLPEQYPNAAPPHVEVRSSLGWLLTKVVSDLESTLTPFWEWCDRSTVPFDFVNRVQEQTNVALRLSAITVPKEFPQQRLTFDHKASKKTFDKDSYEYGICLDNKRATACHRMEYCNRVFCVQCLQDLQQLHSTRQHGRYPMPWF